MPDTNDNSVSVRVPQWVLDEIENQIRDMPRPRPTRGELLTQAWAAYSKGAPASVNGKQTDISAPDEYKKLIAEFITLLEVSKKSRWWHWRESIIDFLNYRRGEEGKSEKISK